jgi:hypothetical protein
MAPPTVPTGFPSRLVAGDTCVFDVGPLRDARGTFASTDYTLTVVVTSPHGKTEATGTAEGAGWRVTLAAATTLALKTPTELEVESLRWAAHCGSGSERYTLASGTALLWPDPASLDGYASANARILALLRAKIEGRLTADVERYTIAGRAFDKIPMMELVKLEGVYAAKVEAERSGGQIGRAVELHFRGAR